MGRLARVKLPTTTFRAVDLDLSRLKLKVPGVAPILPSGAQIRVGVLPEGIPTGIDVRVGIREVDTYLDVIPPTTSRTDSAKKFEFAFVGILMPLPLLEIVGRLADRVGRLLFRSSENREVVRKKRAGDIPRDAASGDYTKQPKFLDMRYLANLVRRYFGSPEARVAAWEDFATYMDRMGWHSSNRAFTEAHRIRSENNLMPPERTTFDLLLETEHFHVSIPRGLLIDRNDGGHIAIFPRVDTDDRMSMEPGQALEYIAVSMAAGKAMMEVLNGSGIPVERLNFMDMGNWRLLTPRRPRFHEHIFGRALGSRFQIHGEFSKIPPKGSPFYKTIEPMNEAEIAKMREILPLYFKTYFDALVQEIKAQQ